MCIRDSLKGIREEFSNHLRIGRFVTYFLLQLKLLILKLLLPKLFCKSLLLIFKSSQCVRSLVCALLVEEEAAFRRVLRLRESFKEVVRVVNFLLLLSLGSLLRNEALLEVRMRSCCER